MLPNISQKKHTVKRITVNHVEIPKKISKKELFKHGKPRGVQSESRIIKIARELVLEYLQDTTIHGLKYLGKVRMKSTVLGKLFWGLIMICSFVFLTWMLWKFWIRYSTNPTRTVIDTFQAPIYLVPFPAVTLCPLIPPLIARRDELLRRLRLPHNMSNHTAAFLLKYGTAFTNERVPAGKQYVSDLKALLKMNHISLVEFIQFLRPCEDMFDSCWWEGVKTNCSELFKVSYTFQGICCSFNYLLEDLIETGNRSRYDTDFRRTTLFGARSGLIATLHKNLLVKNDSAGNHIRFSTNSVGLVMYAHHPLEYVGSISARQILQSKQELRVAVTPLVKKKLANYYQIDKDTGKSTPHCINDTSPLKYFPSYRYPNCFISCSIEVTVKMCGCVPYYYLPMAKKYSLRLCEWEDFGCLYENRDDIRIIRNGKTKNFTCECQNPCWNIFYEIETSSIILNGEHDFNVSPFYKNITDAQAILRLYLSSETYTEMNTIPMADELYLLASIGGIFSLFVGCSFISAIEIFYFIFMFFRSYINPKKSK